MSYYEVPPFYYEVHGVRKHMLRGADVFLYSKPVWIVNEHPVAELKECSEEEDPPRVNMGSNEGSETGRNEPSRKTLVLRDGSEPDTTFVSK